jgi:hypothetical protein
MIFDKLSPLYFLLAFIVGLMVCYVMEPKKKMILKFPSPTNAGKVTYVDKQGQCYKYNVENNIFSSGDYSTSQFFFC